MITLCVYRDYYNARRAFREAATAAGRKLEQQMQIVFENTDRILFRQVQTMHDVQALSGHQFAAILGLENIDSELAKRLIAQVRHAPPRSIPKDPTL